MSRFVGVQLPSLATERQHDGDQLVDRKLARVPLDGIPYREHDLSHSTSYDLNGRTVQTVGLFDVGTDVSFDFLRVGIIASQRIANVGHPPIMLLGVTKSPPNGRRV